jgi:MoaA/NifB/PqqE/SkfB family radical SAM enzyme
MGNFKEYKISTGFMDLETLGKILEKASKEFQVLGVGLFNWTEPVLHPKLPEMIRLIQDKGYSCYLSSNLNNFKNIDEVIKANPYSLRISASGFTQEVYGYSHRGGNIEKVKANMIALAEAKKKYNSTTRLHVLFHRYKHNLKDEPLMREFAEHLGIGFEPVWAFMMPLEKILSHTEGTNDLAVLSEEDNQLINNLALPLKPAMEASARHKDQPCLLQDEQITMDYKGDVQLCCATYDARKFTVGNFLELSIDEIQNRKYAHDFCSRCMKAGGHVYVTYGTLDIEDVAIKNLPKEDVDRLNLRFELKKKRRRKSLEGVYRKVFRRVVSPEMSKRLGDIYDWVQNRIRL